MLCSKLSGTFFKNPDLLEFLALMWVHRIHSLKINFWEIKQRGNFQPQAQTVVLLSLMVDKQCQHPDLLFFSSSSTSYAISLAVKFCVPAPRTVTTANW